MHTPSRGRTPFIAAMLIACSSPQQLGLSEGQQTPGGRHRASVGTASMGGTDAIGDAAGGAMTARSGNQGLGGASTGGNQGLGGASTGGNQGQGGTIVGDGGRSLDVGGSAGQPQAGGAAGMPPYLADEMCGYGDMRFVIYLDSPTNYCNQSYYPTSSSLEILTADRQFVNTLDSANTCVFDRCPTCTLSGGFCYAIGLYQRAADVAFFSHHWDGGVAVRNHCATAGNYCYANRCVPPGRHIARFCLQPKGMLATCNASAGSAEWIRERVCVEMPFEIPTTEVVYGLLTLNGTAGSPNTVGAGGAPGHAGALGFAGYPEAAY